MTHFVLDDAFHALELAQNEYLARVVGADVADLYAIAQRRTELMQMRERMIAKFDAMCEAAGEKLDTMRDEIIAKLDALIASVDKAILAAPLPGRPQ